MTSTTKHRNLEMYKRIVTLLFLPVLVFVSSVVTGDDSAGWYLMSRHGECAAIGALERKLPDIGDIRDPDAFIAFMQAKGFKVTSNALATPQGKVVQVDVPEKGLNLIFADSEVCKQSLDNP